MIGLPCSTFGFDGVSVAHPSPIDNSPSDDNHSDNNDEQTAHSVPSSDTPEEEWQGGASAAPPSSAEESQRSDWFAQIDTLRALAYLVRDEKLSEIEVERGGLRISIKAADAVAPPALSAGALGRLNELYAVSATDFAEDYVSDGAEDAATGTGATATSAAESANLVEVVSPMVGIFYRAPSPSDPNFVEAGDRVEVGQTLCLVETMKVFNEITSEVDGTVVEILAKSGDLLETGDKLMVIRK
jgi:acetyl-CoA carboxylase biotin carboxyl carrier protein